MGCRLFLDQDLQVGHAVSLPDNQAHYLRQVMRLQVGNEITLFNGRGGEFACRIEQLAKANSCCRIVAFSSISREMDCDIRVIQAACRSEKIETVLQKGTELGAAGFDIVASERSALQLDGGKLEKRLQRWRKIIAEAAEQSGRTAMPTLAWHDSLDTLPASGLCLALHPEGATEWDAFRDKVGMTGEIRLAIGPEGGWSPRDMERLEELGFQAMRFGPRILRTETAGPALLAAIQAVKQDTDYSHPE